MNRTRAARRSSTPHPSPTHQCHLPSPTEWSQAESTHIRHASPGRMGSGFSRSRYRRDGTRPRRRCRRGARSDQTLTQVVEQDPDRSRDIRSTTSESGRNSLLATVVALGSHDRSLANPNAPGRAGACPIWQHPQTASRLTGELSGVMQITVTPSGPGGGGSGTLGCGATGAYDGSPAIAPDEAADRYPDQGAQLRALSRGRCIGSHSVLLSPLRLVRFTIR